MDFEPPLHERIRSKQQIFDTTFLQQLFKSNERPARLIIDLFGCDVDNAKARAVAVALAESRALITLCLSINRIGCSGARALAKALVTNQTLTNLDLGRNNVGNGGARALASALKTNQTLRRLNLQQNAIGSGGAHALAVALKQNATLLVLNLMNNVIGDVGMRSLAKMLRQNTTMNTILLWNNSSDNFADFADIAVFCSRNVGLHKRKNEHVRAVAHAYRVVLTLQQVERFRKQVLSDVHMTARIIVHRSI